jgi:hypothetical protein
MMKNYTTSEKCHVSNFQHFKTNGKKMLFQVFLIFLLTFGSNVFGQVVGDYRSNTPLPAGGGTVDAWTTASNWQYYNGSSWITAVTYPGQNPTGTGNVFIQPNNIITLNETGISTGVIGSITISGSLVLDGINTGGNGTDYSFNTQLIIVTTGAGTIFFIDKVDLVLPANAVLEVSNEATPIGLSGSCSHNQDIYIGTSVYSYCAGSPPGTFTFEELMDQNGTFRAIPNSNTPVCEGNQINLLGSFMGAVSAAVNYSWVITPPVGGNITSSTQNTTVPNAIAGTYNVTLTTTTIHEGSLFSNSKTISVLVLPRPATPTVTTNAVTCGAAGSAAVSNYSGANTYAFTPPGPSVNGAGIISGFTVGQSYTVTSNNGTCTSAASLSFTVSNITSTTWNGVSWSNGIPDLTKLAIINGNYDMVNNPSLTNISACSLIINSPAVVTVKGGAYIILENALQLGPGSDFIIKNNGSLIQINNVANTGNIKMERTANIDYRDYVYWSTPVTPFHASNISLTSANYNIYKWIPTFAGNGVGNFGKWVSGNENMIVGLGYIERGLNTAPLNSPVNFTSTFIGVPNNGNITVGIARGTYTGGPYTTSVSTTQATQDDDNWNLIGNPYPSAISADAFLTANSTNLDGYVKIWRHGLSPSTSNSDPFYGNYSYNYNASDYLTYNLSGPSFPGQFDGYIGAGQSFITRMKDSSPSASGSAVFNNSMRSSTYRNDQFFKTTNSADNQSGRIWIDLVSPTETSTSLVAYLEGATNEKDQMFDAGASLNLPFNLYSLIGYERLTIQGKALPFNQNDQVSLAIKVPQNGDYTLAINSVDGFFTDTNQNIYLEDKLLNVIHNLRSAPYQFAANTGEYIDRFVLRYTQTTLGNEDFDLNNSVQIFTDNHIRITSMNQSIKEVMVYDILGKTLFHKQKIDDTAMTINELNPIKSVLIVKIILEDNTVITKKVIF